MAPESRDEVRQRIDSLYERAENATGNFNATRAMAAAARRRGVPPAERPDRRPDPAPAPDAVAQQWFDVARTRFGPTVPAVLPADRLPGRTPPARSRDRAAGGPPGGGRADLAARLPELAPGSAGRPAGRALPGPAGGPPAHPAGRPRPALEPGPTARPGGRPVPLPAGTPEPPAPGAPAPTGRRAAGTAVLPAAFPAPLPDAPPAAAPGPRHAARPDAFPVPYPGAPPAAHPAAPWDVLPAARPAAEPPTVPRTAPEGTAPQAPGALSGAPAAPLRPSPADRRAGTRRRLAAAADLLSRRTGPPSRPAPAAPPAGAGSPGPSTDPGAARAARIAQVIGFARAQIGKPCVWGATGPDSFDCSSLTRSAWRAAGVTLPRAAHQQALAGTPVAFTGIQPGDLVLFFDDDRHVGLYAGDGMIIHAPGPGAFIREESVYGAGEAAVHRVVRPA
ncbi:NlpC/P60 family protein [Streptomyces sp. TG1A-8]|uniref:NlpC/P60 family protein n=1 Tax=Streptomyces sp. TG1A-8 TaxID=3051385 RepID=UPI00265C19B8|nr:NlpC/P60 family protein [Streptomyces sp. TG1A-8]MDO0924475.1 NlpC/P60 family protein [Streptomyces sp. TG1A-8]